jgi:membrane protease YdiL (CAAX protease family)
MQVRDAPSIVFLGFLFILWPWLAIKSSRKLRAVREKSEARPALSRETIWKSTLATEAFMLLAAWWVGRGFGYDIFAFGTIGWREILAALGTLAVLLAVRAAVRASRSEAERRKLVVYAIAPRTKREWTLWIAVVLFASVAEEAAYRGVAMNILWWSLGPAWINGVIAAILVALAFAAAHWVQGWKSIVVIFLTSLVMQGLVVYSNTLVLAMIVHAIYDFIAGERIRREALRLDQTSMQS